MIEELFEYFLTAEVCRLRAIGMSDKNIAKKIVNNCDKYIGDKQHIVEDLVKKVKYFPIYQQINSHYVRFGRKYSVEEVVSLIMEPSVENGWSARRKLFDGDIINFKSQRLATFARSQTCVCCGIVGSFFVKEKQRKCKDIEKLPWHLNFYAIDGSGHEVLMTSDHIIPKSKAPPGLTNNRQTMCCRCNNAKSDRQISMEELRKELGIKWQH